MALIPLKRLAKEFGYTIGTLRVYHSVGAIPMVKDFNRLYVTPETYKRLKNFYSMGIPFSRYRHEEDQSGSLSGYAGSYNVPKFLVLDGGMLPSEMDKTALTSKVKSLTKELKEYEDALGLLVPGYASLTNQSGVSALIVELQKTIANQERQIILSEKRDKQAGIELQLQKKNYDDLWKDRELLNLENQMLRERLPVKQMTSIERGVAALQDADAETLNNIIREPDKYGFELVQEARKLLVKMETKPYTKEEDDRLKEIFNNAIRSLNKPS